MQEEIEPTDIEAVLRLLETKPAGPKKREQCFTKRDVVIPGVLFFSLILSIIISVLAKIGWVPLASALYGSVPLLALGQLGFWAIAARNAWSDFQAVNKTVPESQLATMELDYARLSLTGGISSEELKFLAKRLQLNAEHLRSRVGLLVGTIDKVGVVPLAAGSLYTLWKLRQETHIEASYLITGLATLTLLYLAAMVLTLRSHRIDQCAQMLELAASKDRATGAEGTNSMNRERP